MFRLPLGQISVAKTKTHLRHIHGDPIHDRTVTAVEVPGEQQVPDDENPSRMNMVEISSDCIHVMGNTRDRSRAIIVPKLEIGDVVFGDPIEQVQRRGARVEVRLPNDIGEIVYRVHDL